VFNGFVAEGILSRQKSSSISIWINNLEMNIITRKGLVFAIILLAVLSVAALFISWRIPDINGQTQSAVLVDLAFPNLIFNQPVGLISDDG
jgi:hypothetical protein